MKKYSYGFNKFNGHIEFERKYSRQLSEEEFNSYDVTDPKKRDPKKITEDFMRLLRDFEKESKTNQDEITRFQRYMNYGRYLHTRYWCICRNKKYLQSNFGCALYDDHSDRILNVHHKSYKHRGNDAYHLDKLIVLCELCHHTYEMLEREDKNISNVKSSSKYVESIETASRRIDELEKCVDEYVNKPNVKVMIPDAENNEVNKPNVKVVKSNIIDKPKSVEVNITRPVTKRKYNKRTTKITKVVDTGKSYTIYINVNEQYINKIKTITAAYRNACEILSRK